MCEVALKVVMTVGGVEPPHVLTREGDAWCEVAGDGVGND